MGQCEAGAGACTCWGLTRAVAALPLCRGAPQGCKGAGMQLAVLPMAGPLAACVMAMRGGCVPRLAHARGCVVRECCVSHARAARLVNVRGEGGLAAGEPSCPFGLHLELPGEEDQLPDLQPGPGSAPSPSPCPKAAPSAPAPWAIARSYRRTPPWQPHTGARRALRSSQGIATSPRGLSHSPPWSPAWCRLERVPTVGSLDGLTSLIPMEVRAYNCILHT